MKDLNGMDAIWIIFLFAIGACVGSFLNVVIYRMPRGESIVFPGSHCPSCGKAIRWYDNIPLVSWLALRGKCRFCKARISPRYILIELATAVLVSGLYVCYYILDLREGAGTFEDSWPIFAAHAALLCALLACSAVDIEHWIVPLEVCWVVSIVGAAAGTASPETWTLKVDSATGALAVGAGVGLVISIILQHYGILQPSFLDAQDKPAPEKSKDEPGHLVKKKSKDKPSDAKPRKAPVSVAMTKEHGVNPRREILREVLFLAPAIALAVIAYFLVTDVQSVGNAWAWLNSPKHDGGAGAFGLHFRSFLGALFGFLIGGAVVWGTRILGTLAFGKEAMGLGDVHLMAAVGAVTGWAIPTLAFFIAPFFGLLWALYLWLRRNQRELPYGPWLALGTLTAMLLYDKFQDIFRAYISVMSGSY